MPLNSVRSIVKRDIKIKFFDYARQDGDIIDIYLNGRLIQAGVELISNSFFEKPPLDFRNPYELTLDKAWLNPGENVLEIRAINESAFAATVGVDFEESSTIYGRWRHTNALKIGQRWEIKFGLPKIRVNGTAYPYSADHIIDTLSQPRILTIDRPGADSRRADNLRRYKELGGISPVEGFDQDESPPAVFAESINGHVRMIPSLDNTSSGAQIGIAINYYGGNSIKLQNGWNVDFYATVPSISTPVRVPDVPMDWEYRII